MQSIGAPTQWHIIKRIDVRVNLLIPWNWDYQSLVCLESLLELIWKDTNNGTLPFQLS